MAEPDLGHIAENLRGLATPVVELHADPANARTGHDVQRIAASLRAYGQRKPLVANRAQGGKVEAGNGTLAAALSLGWTHVAVVWVDDDPATAAAFGIADNRTGELSRWDAEALGALADVTQGLFTAFTGDELAEVLGVKPAGTADAEAQVDRAEELRQKWDVRPGDLWRVGEHRLICGDCTDAAVVERVMGGEKAGMVIADPPYGVNIVASNVSVGGGEGPDGMIPFGGVKNKKGYVGGGEGDSLRHGHYAIEEVGKPKRLGGSVGAAKPFGSKNIRGTDGASNIVEVGKYAPIIGDDTIDTAVNSSRFYLDLYPDAVQVWFGANYYAHKLEPSPCWVVWDKEMTGNFADCELAWCNKKRPAKLFRHRWNGMVRDSERERRWHPTQKPAALAAWIMTEFGATGDIVLDPFAGAGWTMIAAQNSGRICRAIEMSVDYLPVILERMATAFPGIVIERVAGDG